MMKRKKSAFKKIICVFAALIIALSVWTAWGNLTVGLTEINIENASVPSSFDGYRIAQISDLHNASFGKNNSMLIKLLEKAEPDIIVITGDIIDSRRTDADVAAGFARQAVGIAPCYYVTGNHEARAADVYPALETELKNCGVTVLHDESVLIEKGGDRIQLSGVDDPMFAERDTGYSSAIIASKLDSLEPYDGFKILLSHRPEIFDTYVSRGIDLVFSGHAHGGQFRIPFIGGVAAPNQGFFPKYDAGVYHKDKTDMIVSRGIGNSYIPVRINNRPEIIVATLKGGD